VINLTVSGDAVGVHFWPEEEDAMFAVTGSEQIPDVEPRGMSKGFVGALVFLLLVALAGGGAYWMRTHAKPAGGVDPRASEAEVRAADAQWAKAAAARDVEGTIAYYSDDAVVMPPNFAMAMDKGAERKAWSEILTPGTEVSWTAGKVEAAKSGEFVYDVGIYTVITKSKGKQTTDGGKYLAVWKKQADGKWKAVAATWNSDKPLPGAKPKG
jgi:ketosteroid isomerase-like protein